MTVSSDCLVAVQTCRDSSSWSSSSSERPQSSPFRLRPTAGRAQQSLLTPHPRDLQDSLLALKGGLVVLPACLTPYLSGGPASGPHLPHSTATCWGPWPRASHSVQLLMVSCVGPWLISTLWSPAHRALQATSSEVSMHNTSGLVLSVVPMVTDPCW